MSVFFTHRAVFCQIFAVMAVLLFSGCTTYKTHYPSDIQVMCTQSFNDSKAGIESKGVKLKMKANVTVQKIPGGKKFSGEWAFWSTELNDWVCGLCYSYPFLLKVASDPVTGAVLGTVVTHEHGHYWLVSNYHDYTHNALYASLFVRWYDMKDGEGRLSEIKTLGDGTTVVIDYPPGYIPGSVKGP